MLRWHNSFSVLSTTLALCACAGTRAQTNTGSTGHQPDFGLEVHRVRYDCGSGPDRTTAMMTGMLGKPVTLATAPVDVLAADLKLDASQKKRIDALQAKLDKDINAAYKDTRKSGGLDMFSKANEVIAQADKDIEAELNAEQRSISVTLLKNLSLLQAAGIPPVLYQEVKLTADQMKSLSDALPDIKQEQRDRMQSARGAGRSSNPKKMLNLMASVGDKVGAILTKDQRSLVENYRKRHPSMMSSGYDLSGLP